MLSFHRSRSVRSCRLNLSTTSSSPSSFTTDAKNRNNYDDDDSCTSTSTSSGHITDLLDVSDHYSRHSCMKSEEEIETETETVTQKKNKKEKKSTVQFSTVHIRDYSLCLGDNPAVSQGPPISLDWYYDNETWYDIDDHDKQEQGRGGGGGGVPCCVPPTARLNLLKQLGYSQRELTKAIRRVEKSKKQRSQTRKRLQKLEWIRSFF